MQIVTAQPPAGGEAMTPFGTESDWERTAEAMSYGNVEQATARLLRMYPDTDELRVGLFVRARRRYIRAERDHAAEDELHRFVHYALIMRGMP